MPDRALDPLLYTRARGAMLGLAAGSQLAASARTLGSSGAMRDTSPNGARSSATPPVGPPFDGELALAMLLAESLGACGGFDAHDVARRWVEWMDADGRGLGVTTRQALRIVADGADPFAAGQRARDAGTPGSLESGAVARCLPVAIWYHDDVDRLVRVSLQQAAITHADDRCLWSAVAVNLAARELLHGNPYFVDEVLHRVKDSAPRVLLDAVRRAAREQQEDLPIERAGALGCDVQCVEIAFWFATHGRSLEEALVFVAAGGDHAATNAAVTGALLGARGGEATIPPRWLTQLAGRDGIVRVTDRLVEGPS